MDIKKKEAMKASIYGQLRKKAVQIKSVDHVGTLMVCFDKNFLMGYRHNGVFHPVSTPVEWWMRCAELSSSGKLVVDDESWKVMGNMPFGNLEMTVMVYSEDSYDSIMDSVPDSKKKFVENITVISAEEYNSIDGRMNLDIARDLFALIKASSPKRLYASIMREQINRCFWYFDEVQVCRIHDDMSHIIPEPEHEEDIIEPVYFPIDKYEKFFQNKEEYPSEHIRMVTNGEKPKDGILSSKQKVKLLKGNSVDSQYSFERYRKTWNPKK